MPAKPSWCSKIKEVVSELERQPRTFVDRATVEFLLGVGRRRAQQILAPCVTDRVGGNGLADREALIVHLRKLAGGESGRAERQRRIRVARSLAGLRPRLLVEAPAEIELQKLENLPAGVQMEPGRISVTFDHPREALEKLLALAMAIRNDFERFERQVGPEISF